MSSQSASQVATILQKNPAVLELDRFYNTNSFSLSILVLEDIDATNLQIMQAKKIVKNRRALALRKARG